MMIRRSKTNKMHDILEYFIRHRIGEERPVGESAEDCAIRMIREQDKEIERLKKALLQTAESIRLRAEELANLWQSRGGSKMPLESSEVQQERIYRVIKPFFDFYRETYIPTVSKGLGNSVSSDGFIRPMLEATETELRKMVEGISQKSAESALNALHDDLKSALTGIAEAGTI